MTREAAGAGAPAPPPRLTPTQEGGGAQPPPRWRITPLYAKHKPPWRACGRQVGRLLVSEGFQQVLFYVGAGFRHGCAPRPRAHLSRPPRSERSPFAVESVGGAGFLVTVGPGAHGTCAGREGRLGGRPAGAPPTYPAPRAMPQRKGRFSRTASRRARLQCQAVQKHAPGGARCVHSGAHADALRVCLLPSRRCTVERRWGHFSKQQTTICVMREKAGRARGTLVP